MSQEEQRFRERSILNAASNFESEQQMLIANIINLTNALSKLPQDVVGADAAINAMKQRLDQLTAEYNISVQKQAEFNKIYADTINAQRAAIQEEEALAVELENIRAQRAKLGKEGALDANTAQQFNARESAILNTMSQATGEIAAARRALDAANQNGGVRQIIYDNAVSDSTKDKWAEGSTNSVVNLLDQVNKSLKSIGDRIGRMVDSTISVLSATYGRINANLEGTGETFISIKENIESALGATGYLKEAEYLSEIATLTSAGLNLDVESRALLNMMSSKTLSTFNSMEGSLTRLVRLKQTDVTTSQFGLELQLKRVLNSVFKDTSYLNDLYDTVTGAITDAGVMTGSDLTSFNSTVQTWLGAMYESGLSSNIVNAIASGINALGSGNVSALASSPEMQKLFLLSMDTIGLDYASILQQGLTSSDTNALLSAMVNYLADIADQTEDNLVLESAYGNLFGMSLSDMTAIKNLADNASIMSSSIINSNTANVLTKQAMSEIVTQNTLGAEYIDNALSNIQFMFGSSIAEDKSKYYTFKVSQVAADMLDSMGSIGDTTMQGLIQGLELSLRALQLSSVAIPLYETLQDISLSDIWNQTNDLGSLLVYNGNIGDVSSYEYVNGGGAPDFKTMIANKNASVTPETIEADSTAMLEEASKDETLEEIKKLTKALVYNNENPAVAVFLEGMTDDTLRSFASIFADEDAMMSTFTGENNVLEGALFQYAGDDTASNSTTTEAGTTTTTITA